MVTDGQRLVCVRTCQGWHVAQIYKAKLEVAEIPVLLEYESAGIVFGITVDGLGEVRVMVPESHAEEAAALLEDIQEPFPVQLEGMDEDTADNVGEPPPELDSPSTHL